MSESCTAKGAEEIVVEESACEDPRADAGTDASLLAAEDTAMTQELQEEAQVVPIWEPEAQQEDRSQAAQTLPREKRDNNINEVCPWEDE